MNKNQAPPPGGIEVTVIEDVGPPHFPGPVPKPKTILKVGPDGRIVIVPQPIPPEPPAQAPTE